MHVIVSGGSRGLGLAIVEHLVARGDSVATFSRTATSELREIAAAAHGRLLSVEADARDSDAMRELVDRTANDFGSVDVLVNNAAVGQDALLAHLEPRKISELIQVNVEAPIMLTRLVLRRMLMAADQGRVVNITSICARQGYAGLAVYSATKGALESLTRSLAQELQGRVLVNAIAPGFFGSEMTSVLSATQLEVITRRTPSGKLTTPEMILPILDLLIEPGGNINGEVVTVDGGTTA